MKNIKTTQWDPHVRKLYGQKYLLLPPTEHHIHVHRNLILLLKQKWFDLLETLIEPTEKYINTLMMIS